MKGKCTGESSKKKQVNGVIQSQGGTQARAGISKGPGAERRGRKVRFKDIGTILLTSGENKGVPMWTQVQHGWDHENRGSHTVQTKNSWKFLSYYMV